MHREILQNTSPSCSIAEGVHPGSCKSNAISRRCGGSRAQARKNEERWSSFNRCSSAVEGDVTVEAASPVSSKLVTAETWQSGQGGFHDAGSVLRGI